MFSIDPEIEVWMRTVAHGRVVKFRTFLRTLLHEVCHHLDATLYEMAESFHTHGFYARESSLVEQLAQTPRLGDRLRRSPASVSLGATPSLNLPEQLNLFDQEAARRRASRDE